VSIDEQELCTRAQAIGLTVDDLQRVCVTQIVRVLRYCPASRRREAIDAALALVEQPPGMLETALGAGVDPIRGEEVFDHYMRPALQQKGS
jgi:hypothetical protein